MAELTVSELTGVGRLDIQLLRSFLAISKSPTLSSAAEYLNIPQPTMSLQMKRLEDRAGCMLFEPGRRGKPLRLSAQGERLVRHATRIIDAYEDAVQSLAHADMQGQLRLGIPSLLSESGIMGMLKRFKNVFEGVNLIIMAADAQALKDMVSEGRLDARICVDEAHPQGRVLWSEGFHWVCAADKSVLQKYPLPVGVLSINEPFRDYVTGLLDDTGPQWFEAFTSDSFAKIYTAAAAGQVVAAVPKSLITKDVVVIDNEMNLPRLTEVPFAIYTNAALSREPKKQQIIDTLGDFLEEKMAKLVTA